MTAPGHRGAQQTARQHLEIALPAGAKVWSTFVAGQAVKPSLREGRLLLPLENAGSDDAAPRHRELTYVATNQFPANHGNVNLVSPTLDVPFKNARWSLVSAARFPLRRVHRHDVARGGTAEASSFSFLDYSQKESAARAEAQKD